MMKTPPTNLNNAVSAVTAAELSKATKVFSMVKQLRLRLSNVDETALDTAFEVHVQGVLEKLETRLPLLGDKQLKNAEVVMAKHGLYDAGFQQVILLCQTISPALSDSLKDLRSTHSGFMTELQLLIGEFVKEANQLAFDTSQSKSETARVKKECEELQSTVKLLDQEAEERNQQIIELRKQLRQSQKEILDIREKFGVQNTTSISTLPPPPPTIKTTASASMSSSSSSSPSPSSSNIRRSFSNSTTISASSKRRSANDMVTKNNSYINNSGNSTAIVKVNESNWLEIFRSEMQRAIDEGRCRSMTLKECKEVIEKVVETKKQATMKALKVLETSGPLSATASSPILHIETIEQHLYHFMEKKYGLRNLAVEHAGKVLSAVERYMEEDNSVAVFHKLFRNEIEEEFWLVQNDLTKSIRDLLAVQLMGKNPNKDQGVVMSLLEQKMASYIYEDEWTDIVNYLYSGSDSAAICIVLKRLARDEMMQNSQEQLGNGKGNSQINSSSSSSSQLQSRGVKDPKKLGFSRSAGILDFQLRAHVQYLSAFRRTFERFDKDADGMLTNNEFKSCIKSLRAGSPNKNKQHHQEEDNDDDDDDTFYALLQIVDPLQSGKITFSIAAANLSKVVLQ